MMRRGKGHKSYFYKFLVNFLSILCIPIVTILFIFLQAESIVKEQIIIASRNTLEQFFGLLDATAQEMGEICLALAENADCMNYARFSVHQPEKTTYLTYQLKRQLANYPREKYYDIFVYFPYEDRIISNTNASLTSAFYYDTYYKSQEYDSRGEFYGLLNCNEKRPAFYAIDSKSRDSYLCVSMKRHNYSDTRLNYTVAVVLNLYDTSRLLRGSGDDWDGDVMIFDRDKNLLLTGSSRTIPYSLDGYSGSDSAYETIIGEDRYMMQVRKSEVLKGYYASAVPFHYFWKQLRQMRIFCGLGWGACICFSVWLAYKGTLRTYRPLETIVARLQEQAEISYDGRENTELEFIESLFEKTEQEKFLLNRKIKSGDKMRRERFLLSLLEGKANGDGGGDDIFRKNGIALCSDQFLVGALSITPEMETEPEMLMFIVCNVFEEVCGRAHKGYVVPVSAGRCYLLINLRAGAGEEEPAALIGEGKTFLEQYCRIGCTIGISLIHAGMTAIHTACEEAEQALKYRFLYGFGRIIEFRKIMGREFQYPTSGESKLSGMVAAFIRENGPAAPAVKFTAELMDRYEIREESSLETVEYFKLEAVNAVNRALLSGGYPAETRKAMVNGLLKKPTLWAFQEEFSKLLAMLRQREQERAGQDDVCMRAQNVIKRNYADPQLSVSSLASELDITPSYLSRLFKEKYGVSILDFISELRIRKAKEALRDTEKSIREISEEQGFLSSNVFIKAFRKWEGITPGVYRELASGNKT